MSQAIKEKFPVGKEIMVRVPAYDFDLKGVVVFFGDDVLKVRAGNLQYRPYDIPYSEIDVDNPENSRVRVLSEEEVAYSDQQQSAAARRYASYGSQAGMTDPYAPEPGYGPSW